MENKEVVKEYSVVVYGDGTQDITVHRETIGFKPTSAVNELDLVKQADAECQKAFGDSFKGSMLRDYWQSGYIKGYTDHAQQSTAKYVGIVEGEIERLRRSAHCGHEYHVGNNHEEIADLLTDLLTKFKEG